MNVIREHRNELQPTHLQAAESSDLLAYLAPASTLNYVYVCTDGSIHIERPTGNSWISATYGMLIREIKRRLAILDQIRNHGETVEERGEYPTEENGDA